MKTAAALSAGSRLSDHEFNKFSDHLSGWFFEGVKGPLFTTDVDPDALWAAFLHSLPPGEKQHYNCSCCRHFLKRFGALAAVSADGHLSSPIWACPGIPDLFREFADRTARDVSNARITGAFVTGDEVLGTPVTGPWHHFSLKMPAELVFARSPLATPGQHAAKLAHNFEVVERAVRTFGLKLLASALNIVKSEALDRTEKVEAGAHWLYDTAAEYRGAKNHRLRENLLWARIAVAPDGFCHPRASMLGTLLEDLEAGKSFEVCKRNFNEKMHPLKYQRPQAAPTEGNIDRAEKVFEALGLAPALRRRVATLEEVTASWRPTNSKPAGGGGEGVFDRLRGPREDPHPGVVAKAGATRWQKFREKVLPDALEIYLKVPGGYSNFGAIVGPVNPEAPCLFRWGNPYSWYVYNGGSTASRWSLSHDWVRVVAVCEGPSEWGSRAEQPLWNMLILEGARETQSPGLALFPETLRPELREVRSVIERFSNTGMMENLKEGSACGLVLSKEKAQALVRVRTALGETEYEIKEWD